MSNKKIPAVSVVIPMYNAEKYIGECLDSILAQTFQDFEVIVVDDCSTDNSRAVVESYIPKFEDKLQLIRLKKNSGNPTEPTNMGIDISRGEYLFILDNDDIITKTALEELYPIAKKFNADVVHCERFLQFNDGEQNLTVEGYQSGKLVTEPTFITENLKERVKDLYNKRFLWNLWSKLIRRDFLFENDIKMIDVMAQDVLFTWFMVLSAPRYLRVPNIVNFYRIRKDSLFHKKEDVRKTLHMRFYAAVKGFRHFKEFLNKINFLRTGVHKG